MTLSVEFLAIISQMADKTKSGTFFTGSLISKIIKTLQKLVFEFIFLFRLIILLRKLVAVQKRLAQ